MIRWRRMIAAAVATLLAGCESGPTSRPDAGAAATRVVQTGLIAERWRVPRATGIVEEIFASAESRDAAIDDRGVEMMRRDGFRCAVGDLDLVERTLRGGGPDGLAGRTWHGEATTWRSLIGRRTQQGTVLLVDGRARRLPESVVSIEIRGWSIPTPEDAAIHLQVVPMVTTSASPRIGAAPSQPGRLRGTSLSTALESTLEPGQCLLLASVPRLQASSVAETDPSEDEAPDSTSREDGIGTGPTGVLPATIAGWLLEDAIADSESLIVIHGRPHAGARTVAMPPG